MLIVLHDVNKFAQISFYWFQYSVFLIMLAVGNIAIGIYALAAFKEHDYRLESHISRDLNTYIAKYANGRYEEIDFIQSWVSV